MKKPLLILCLFSMSANAGWFEKKFPFIIAQIRLLPKVVQINANETTI